MLQIIQNDPQVPSGLFGRFLEEVAMDHRTVRLFAGEALPPLSEVSALIVLGGTMGVHERERYPFLGPLGDFMHAAAGSGTPLLGICLGGQMLADVLGGRVQNNRFGEKGVRQIRLTAAASADPLFSGLPASFNAFQWHNDSFDLPPGAVHLASSSICPGQAFRYRNAWGLQFHPEVDEAIVEEWSSGSEECHLAFFREQKSGLLLLSRHLMRNFLSLIQFRPSPLSDSR